MGVFGGELGRVGGHLGKLDPLALQGFVFAADEIGRVDPLIDLLDEVARRHDGALERIKRHGNRPARRFQHAPLRIHDDQGQGQDDQNNEPHSFWQAPIEDAAERLAKILREEAADVLTVYDSHGNYGHPDHIQVHRVGHRAADLAGTPVVYEATMNRDAVHRMDALAAELAPDLDFEPPELPEEMEFGTPEADLTTAIDVGAYDPRTGLSYGELAARSRSQHQSQGFGVSGERGPVLERFVTLAGSPASKDPFEGIPVGWERYGEAGAPVTRAIEKARTSLELDRPERILPALLEAHRALDGLPAEPRVVDARAAVERLAASASGLFVRATAVAADDADGDERLLLRDRQADGGDVGNPGATGEGRLDVRRRYAMAERLDDVIGAPVEPHIAVIID